MSVDNPILRMLNHRYFVYSLILIIALIITIVRVVEFNAPYRDVIITGSLNIIWFTFLYFISLQTKIGPNADIEKEGPFSSIIPVRPIIPVSPINPLRK